MKKYDMILWGMKVYTKEMFPDCFPDNFVTELNVIEDDIELEELEVFRVSDNGQNDKLAFKSTYEKYVDGEITDKDLSATDFLTNFSTSCNYKKNKIRGILRNCLKREPKACILTGHAVHECGPSQVTSKRMKCKSNGHVDWWLFKESMPQQHFEVYEDKQIEEK